MANGLSFTPDGNTVCLSVGNTSHSAVTITCTSGGAPNLYIQNPSSNAVFFNIAGTGTAVAAVIPTDGTPANGYIVPAGGAKVIGPIGPNPSVTAIASVAGPSAVYITPGWGGVTA